MIAAAEYGKALFSLAKESRAEDAILETLKAVRDMLSNHPAYIKLLDTPAIPTDEKLGLIDKSFGECEQIVLNFIKILCEKHAVYQLHACVATYIQLYNEEKGICEATCISAMPLTDFQKNALCHKITTMTHKRVQLTEKVDSTLIGGMILLVDGKQLDGSVKTRLDNFRLALADIIV